MDFVQVKASDDDNGRRLDRILRRYLDGLPLPALYRSLRAGLVKVNGKKRDGSYRVQSGDVLALAAFLCPQQCGAATDHDARAGTSDQKPQNASLAVTATPACDSVRSARSQQRYDTTAPIPDEWVLFRGNDVLVLNKPYGIPVQPASKNDLSALSVLVAVDYALRHGTQTSLAFRPAPLHRLDRRTTGLLVCSQSLAGAHRFSEMLRCRQLEKHYVALLCGTLADGGHWHNAIEKRTNARAFHTVSVAADANDDKKCAITDAMPLAHGKLYARPVTLAQFVIHTGRTHQIRAQAAAHGFPLLGDTAYGAPPLHGFRQALFLHAMEVRLPPDEETACFLPPLIRAPLPAAFTEILSAALIKWDGRLIL